MEGAWTLVKVMHVRFVFSLWPVAVAEQRRDR